MHVYEIGIHTSKHLNKFEVSYFRGGQFIDRGIGVHFIFNLNVNF